MNADARCSNCRFFYALEELCRRNPPIVVPLQVDPQGRANTMSLWPPVKASWWCGEFKAESKLEVTP